MREYKEKRDFIRMKIDAEVTLTIDSHGKQIAGKCKDLSGSGLSVDTSEALETGIHVQVTLPSRNPAFSAFESEATVTRCERRDDGSFGIGLELQRVP